MVIGLCGGDAAAIAPATPLSSHSLHTSKLVKALGSGPDAALAVRLFDRSVVSGYVAEAGPESFVVVDPATGSSRSIPYAAVIWLSGFNMVSGTEVHQGTGFGAKVRGTLAYLLPARPAPASHFSTTKTLIVGIVIGIVLAIVLAKTV
jgi:hypothetical protein